MTNQPDTTDTLPAYVCTKKIRAGKIIKIEPPATEGARIWHLYLEGQAPGSFIFQPVTREYVAQHAPVAGGWFLRDAEGVAGYCGPGQFEADYARAFVQGKLVRVDDAYLREVERGSALA